METITEETKEKFKGIKGVEYRVDNQAVEKPATKSPWDMERQLIEETVVMELLLVYEVNEWEQLFWNKLKALLDQIGNDRVEVKERLTREWRADCWKRLNSQKHAVEKWLGNYKTQYTYILRAVSKRWAALSISQFFEGVDNQNSISLREEIQSRIDKQEQLFPLYESRPRMENEMEDIEFRLKRGSELGQFDQFWDDDEGILFRCRYSRSKWLCFDPFSQSAWRAPPEIFSHALKENKNIIHISFNLDTRFSICDLPWLTSISTVDHIGQVYNLLGDIKLQVMGSSHA